MAPKVLVFTGVVPPVETAKVQRQNWTDGIASDVSFSCGTTSL